jgi:hypothetical protein
MHKIICYGYNILGYSYTSETGAMEYTVNVSYAKCMNYPSYTNGADMVW